MFLTMIAAVSLSRAWAGINFKSADEVQARLQVLTGLAGKAADEADRLVRMAGDPMLDISQQSDTLNLLANDINQMGREKAALQDQRTSLAAWEQQTIDLSLPLLRACASGADNTINSFNENRMHVWVPEYRESLDRLNNNLNHLSTVLHRELKLAKLRMQEEHLRASAVEAGSN
jgi:hypothetical protein